MEQPSWVWGRGLSQLRRGAAVLAVVASAVVGTAAGMYPWSASAQPSDFRAAEVPTEQGPPQPDHLAAAWYQKQHPRVVPTGTNDFGCTPDAERPRPVILAHGTDSSAYSDYSAIAPRLAAAGFCVFALNYGGAPGALSYGTEDLPASGRQLALFVDQVLAATGAAQVDLVGFSQGANVTRYYTNKLGGAPNVGRWVGLASPSYGGVMYGLVPIAQAIPGVLQVFERVTSLAAVQQAQGSPVMTELNAGGDTVPGPEYITVGSRVDEMIQPFGNIALHGPNARNIALQDLCAADLTGHFHMVYDPFVQELLIGVLDPEHAPEPVCAPVPLGTGIPQVVIAGNS
ncbi:esterase/lipase family protein [Nocardia asteroides]|uniref:esterase/lipase family protein n=1 Tax=Nocardia asteroides TaxID=1824 RepID=UPI001E3BF4DF|nr:alpha/beta fold hydrolase [Nocardia asteroides]UGT63230.1 lipase [Nocardia asteroides]